jgi:2-keto-4-pentenoate hydratase/2-oxohepta-3-ene-1,7-dioic acid hydratase in catechol pathway
MTDSGASRSDRGEGKMRLATIRFEGEERLIRADGDEVDLLPAQLGSLRSLLTRGEIATVGATAVERRLRLDEVVFLPPVTDPEKIICVGLNYHSHLEETGEAPPHYPPLFVRFPSSQVGHGAPVVAPSISEEFDYEGELAVIIGRPAWRVAETAAMDFVAGYSCFAENSARDFQRHSRQATAGKNFLASGAFGPWLTTADEVPDPKALTLTSRLNGEVMQQDKVGGLVFDIPQLIAYITAFTRLMPGDVISTGSGAGVGALRKPPVWLKPGDVFEVEISQVGLLRNPVTSEAEAGVA